MQIKDAKSLPAPPSRLSPFFSCFENGFCSGGYSSLRFAFPHITKVRDELLQKEKPKRATGALVPARSKNP